MAELDKPKSSENITNLLDSLINLKREVFSCLDQALELDQKNSTSTGCKNSSEYDNVIVLYEKSLKLTEKALNFYNIHKSKFMSNQEATNIFVKLNSIKTQAIDRLNVLKSGQNTLKTSDIDMKFLDIGEDVLLVDDIDEDIIVIEPPNYPGEPKKQDATKTENDKSVKTFNYTDSKKATEILRLENCAQLFYIGTDGTVSTPSTMKNVSIYTFDQDAQEKTPENKEIQGFIKCGDWMYPLVANDNPGMKTNFNAYIFPNNDQNLNTNLLSSSAECSFIGITLNQQRMMPEQISFFEDILTNFNSLVYQDTSKASSVKIPILDSNLEPKEVVIDDSKNKGVKSTWSAEGISESIMNGAQMIGRGLGTTTEYANKYIEIGGEKLKSSLAPNEEMTKISPAVQTVSSGLRKGTKLTVRVSSYLVDKLGSMVSYTAKTAAPHVKKGTTSLLTSTGMASNSESASSTVDDVCKVGSSSLKGFFLVYESLEQAAKTLGTNFTEQTVTVVNHKYGPDAAKLTENSMYSAGNIALAVNNYKGLKLKKIPKAVAKETAKEVVLDYKAERKENKNNDVKEN